ncbi:hypothetical protein L596_020034 [Steinernema carpocapsae]|uniref:Uncharacterized protein n=1 Tax=Steinernema carpocapsae TaxID=34508 RepID=A0A4V6A0T3_STECR|nr:hypothetical protein L596_020034 [Steinernema carpocapsae]
MPQEHIASLPYEPSIHLLKHLLRPLEILKMPSARSLRSFTIMALTSGPETDQGDQKILCSSFRNSLLRLERVFAFFAIGLPRSTFRLRNDGAVDVLSTLQVLKMKPVDILVLTIYMGTKVDKKLLYNRLSQKEKKAPNDRPGAGKGAGG